MYQILRGQVESIEGEGQRQRLGPMDVLYIPEQSPHCVRTVGDEDVLLMYVHDEHEPLGASKYVPDGDPSLDDPDPHPSVIRWDDLAPSWDAPAATEAGHLRWSVSWVGGSDGALNLNPETAARHDRVALGATVITAANAAGPERWDTVRCLQVAKGRVVVEGRPELGLIEPLDVLVVPRGYPHTLRAVGLEGATVIWWHEDNVLETTAGDER